MKRIKPLALAALVALTGAAPMTALAAPQAKAQHHKKHVTQTAGAQNAAQTPASKTSAASKTHGEARPAEKAKGQKT